MIEVSKDKFQEITSKIPYTTTFLFGNSATRYNATKGLFKGTCFAKTDNGKYYVNKKLIN